MLEAIDPEKDADGFHPVNVGLLAIGSTERALVPCTPAGSLVLVEKAAAALGVKLDGLNAVIVGRSNIVGKPMVQLLLAKNMTVTVAHSRTKDLAGVVRAADLVVAAVGRPEMVKGDWIKKGAIVIDVGINRIEGEGKKEDGTPKTKLVGDVDFKGAVGHAAAITPGAGRRRPNDHRHADVEHAALGRARRGIAERRRPSPPDLRFGTATRRRRSFGYNAEMMCSAWSRRPRRRVTTPWSTIIKSRFKRPSSLEGRSPIRRAIREALRANTAFVTVRRPDINQH